jgi:hypothetical protein
LCGGIIKFCVEVFVLWGQLLCHWVIRVRNFEINLCSYLKGSKYPITYFGGYFAFKSPSATSSQLKRTKASTARLRKSKSSQTVRYFWLLKPTRCNIRLQASKLLFKKSHMDHLSDNTTCILASLISIRLKCRERETFPYDLMACSGRILPSTLTWKLTVWTSAKEIIFYDKNP